MRTASLGVLASLGIGVFVANAQGGGSGWEVKRQPWSSSSQQWSESTQWSEEWKWSANQQLPAAPGSAWQFSQSNTVAPPLPPGSSSSGKWTWIPSPASQGGFFWSYSSSSSSSPSSSSQGLGVAPGTPWLFSQSNTTPPPLPAGLSVGSWKWVSGPSGGYYWSFIPGPKQDLPTPPGTAWQFSQSNKVAPALPAGSTSGSWKWISAPSGGGYYWSFTAGPKQSLPPAPGTDWTFSTSSTTAPPLPAGVSGSGTWKWVSNPDGQGYYWSFIPSAGSKKPQQSLPEPPAGGSGWIFTASSTVPPPKPAGSSSTGSWTWVSAPNGNGFYWSYLSSPQSPQEQLPPPQSGSTEWIFSSSKTTPPALPQGISGTAGSWRWVSAPNGNGFYWSFTPSSPSSQQLPAPKPGSTGWVFSPSNTTPPTISGTTGSGSWTWISNASGNGYYWSWSPGAPQGVPSGYQGGSVTSDSGTTGQQGQGTQPISGTGGFPVNPGQQGGSSQYQPGQQGGVPDNPGQQAGSFDQGGAPVNPQQPSAGGNIPTQGTGDFPIQGGDIQQGGSQPQTGDQGQAPIKGPFGGSFDLTGKPVTGGNVPGTQTSPQGSGDVPLEGVSQPQTGDQGQAPVKGPFGGSFDLSGKPVTGNIPGTQTGTQGSGNVPLEGGSQPQTGDQGQAHIKGPFGGSFDSSGKPVTGGDVPGTQPGTQGSGNVPIQGGDILQGGSQPQTGDQGQVPIQGPFGGRFDHGGRPIDTTGGSTTGGFPVNPSTGDQPSTKPDFGGGSLDSTGRPIEAGGSTDGSHSSGGFPSTQPGTSGELPAQENPQTGGTGSIPGTGGEGGVIKGPFGGHFDHTGRPVDGVSTSDSSSSGGVTVQGPGTAGENPLNPQTGDTGSIPSTGGEGGVIKGPFGGHFDQTGRPVEGGGLTSGPRSSDGVPVEEPGTTGETPLNPQTGDGGSEEDIVKGPFGGSFDKGGKPIDTGSQGTYKCPPRSRIELLDAPTVPEAGCPNAQDRRWTAEGGENFYILCCRHVDGGKKEIAVIPDIPSLQYCINICAGTAGCKSVLYTARTGYNSNYPLNTCQLFEHGNYDVQTPCNNDAHDSAYLIEPPTGTTGDVPPSPIATPDVLPPPQVDIPPSFVMLPPGISEQCLQNVFAAIRCGTCAGC